MKPTKNDSTPVRDLNPVTNRQLYAQAEAASNAVFLAWPAKNNLEKCAKQMDRAGRKVFVEAGVPTDVADLYSCAITADIIERDRNTQRKSRVVRSKDRPKRRE
ncbi:MAG TPA: hypothetical protein PLN52_07110 [Opitutaceae bacterium]|nr:hypothetical protein [Opitutaceae bacterium]